MNLDISIWKEFRIGDLFIVSGTKTTSINALQEYGPGDYPYVTTQSTNNAVAGYYDFYTENGNVLVVDSAVAGFCSYQERKFSASDHVEKLTPIFEMNRYSALFLATIINAEQYRYSYGRKFNQKKIKETFVSLPVDLGGYPDWGFMENYIKTLRYKPITTKKNPKVLPQLNTDEWGKYTLGELFKFYKGKRLIKVDMTEGAVNFIGAISENNGVRQIIDVEPMFEPNCITVNYNGSVGEAFYQNEPFWASDDVNVLYADGWELNKHIAMFIITVIKANRYKFSYGRKWTLEKMKESTIKLPKSLGGSPDFLYMENYIRSLPYSDRI